MQVCRFEEGGCPNGSLFFVQNSGGRQNALTPGDGRSETNNHFVLCLTHHALVDAGFLQMVLDKTAVQPNERFFHAARLARRTMRIVILGEQPSSVLTELCEHPPY